MSSKRTGVIVATGARLLVGAVVAVGSVVAVAAAVVAPWPSVTTGHAQTAVRTVPGDAVLSCTGSFRALGRDAHDASRMEAAATSRITAAGDPADPERVTIETPDLVHGDGAPVLTRPVDGRQSPLVAASEALNLDEDDLTGLAAGSCGEPSTDSWIVGGSGRTGESDVIVLSNPGTVAATVTLGLYAEQPTSSSIVVPPETQVAVPLASLAAGVETPVVRVTAAGAPVRAVLQSAFVSVLDPAGVDLQPAMAQPAPTLRFAGVQVAARSVGGASANVLRLLSPSGSARADVVIRDLDGDAVGRFDAPLEAGLPLDIALPDLDPGTYSVQVEADAPLVGAVWQSSGTGAGTDFAWMLPAVDLKSETMFAVPSGPAPHLHLLAPEGSTVELTDQRGTTTRVTIESEGGAVVPLRSATGYRLSSEATVAAAVTMSSEGRLAGWPIEPGAAAPKEITVLP